jgi:hypothetical protein
MVLCLSIAVAITSIGFVILLLILVLTFIGGATGITVSDTIGATVIAGVAVVLLLSVLQHHCCSLFEWCYSLVHIGTWCHHHLLMLLSLLLLVVLL